MVPVLIAVHVFLLIKVPKINVAVFIYIFRNVPKKSSMCP